MYFSLQVCHCWLFSTEEREREKLLTTLPSPTLFVVLKTATFSTHTWTQIFSKLKEAARFEGQKQFVDLTFGCRSRQSTKKKTTTHHQIRF